MARRPHRHAASVAQARRAARIPALLMLIIALGAAVLVSAGSPHHQPASTTTASAVITAATDAVVATPTAGTALGAPGHEHHHGTDWTPNLTQRLRPATAVASVPVPRIADAGTLGALPAGLEMNTSGTGLTLLGVLRV